MVDLLDRLHDLAGIILMPRRPELTCQVLAQVLIEPAKDLLAAIDQVTRQPRPLKNSGEFHGNVAPAL